MGVIALKNRFLWSFYCVKIMYFPIFKGQKTSESPVFKGLPHIYIYNRLTFQKKRRMQPTTSKTWRIRDISNSCSSNPV